MEADDLLAAVPIDLRGERRTVIGRVCGDGWPRESRGVVDGMPGLYFAGLAFQYAIASMLVGGAGRDAAILARHIAARSSTGQARSPVS